jgi:hypothetical protein
VGLNRVNASADGRTGGFHGENRFEGLLGGIAVYNESLAVADVAAACRVLGRRIDGVGWIHGRHRIPAIGTGEVHRKLGRDDSRLG